MHWLNTVKFKNLHPVMILVILRIEDLVSNVWITSANDSTHIEGSKHYLGRALDFRTHDLDSTVKSTLANDISEALGSDFFVQLEDLNGPNEHLHVQYNGE